MTGRVGTAVVRKAAAAPFRGVPGVVAAYVYGSAGRARRPFRADSDVDVAVLFAPSCPPGVRGRILDRGTDQLERRLHRRVDLVALNHAPLLLAHQVLKYGVRVLERDRRLCRRLEAYLTVRYLDFLPTRRIMTSGVVRRWMRGRHG